MSGPAANPARVIDAITRPMPRLTAGGYRERLGSPGLVPGMKPGRDHLGHRADYPGGTRLPCTAAAYRHPGRADDEQRISLTR
jgi:hypothetical protein